jgi:hypothetical protein
MYVLLFVMLYSPFWFPYVYENQVKIENMQAKKLNGFDVPIATVEDELELSCSSS